MIAEALESMDRNDVWRFYAAVNNLQQKTAPVPVMCNDREGHLRIDKQARFLVIGK